MCLAALPRPEPYTARRRAEIARAAARVTAQPGTRNPEPGTDPDHAAMLECGLCAWPLNEDLTESTNPACRQNPASDAAPRFRDMEQALQRVEQVLGRKLADALAPGQIEQLQQVIAACDLKRDAVERVAAGLRASA